MSDGLFIVLFLSWLAIYVGVMESLARRNTYQSCRRRRIPMRPVQHSQFTSCRKMSMDPKHYRSNGTCKC